MKITNAHIHTFRDIDVPVKFLPLRLVWLFRIFGGVLTKIMKVVLPSERDILHRYASFIITGRLGSQKKIFEAVAKEYPPNTQFFVLTMDMAFMGAGRVPRSYEEQVREICQLSVQRRNIKVFIHIDPRRSGVVEMLKNYNKCYQIAGIKIYPPLGYAPNNPVLMECYDYCEKNGLAVVSHCSPSNPVRFKGKMEELYKLLDDAGIYYDKKMSRAELCALFTNPRNWIEIAIKYPNLPINLAHLGSADEMKKWLKDEANDPNNWLNIIRNECLKKHKNLYSDTSFTFYEDKFIDVLKTVIMANKEIKGQIMFGTDYYMNETKTNEREYVLGIRRKIGEENFKLIAETNINRFLNFKKMKETEYTEITDDQIMKEINDIEELKIKEEMKVVKLVRYKQNDKQTIGILSVSDTYACDTLELSWNNNETRKSCIPAGVYECRKRISDKYGEHFELLKVPDRSMILIHAGNYNSDTKGCVLVGSGLADINKDGETDVLNSKKTMAKLVSLLPSEFLLEIVEKF
jgi:uncharacterized protein